MPTDDEIGPLQKDLNNRLEEIAYYQKQLGEKDEELRQARTFTRVANKMLEKEHSDCLRLLSQNMFLVGFCIGLSETVQNLKDDNNILRSLLPDDKR
jgi:hypothetical protein